MLYIINGINVLEMSCESFEKHNTTVKKILQMMPYKVAENNS